MLLHFLLTKSLSYVTFELHVGSTIFPTSILKIRKILLRDNKYLFYILACNCELAIIVQQNALKLSSL